jgi:hypothetical protein
MIIFIIGMIALIINKINNWWVWLVYISIWTWAEASIAKNFHLKWWHWLLIIGGLSIIDLAIIKFFV